MPARLRAGQRQVHPDPGTPAADQRAGGDARDAAPEHRPDDGPGGRAGDRRRRPGAGAEGADHHRRRAEGDGDREPARPEGAGQPAGDV